MSQPCRRNGLGLGIARTRSSHSSARSSNSSAWRTVSNVHSETMSVPLDSLKPTIEQCIAPYEALLERLLEQAPVEIEMGGAPARQRELLFGPATRGLAEPQSELRVVDEPRECLSDGLRLLRRRQVAGLAVDHRFGHAVDRRGHDGE